MPGTFLDGPVLGYARILGTPGIPGDYTPAPGIQLGQALRFQRNGTPVEVKRTPVVGTVKRASILSNRPPQAA